MPTLTMSLSKGKITPVRKNNDTFEKAECFMLQENMMFHPFQ